MPPYPKRTSDCRKVMVSHTRAKILFANPYCHSNGSGYRASCTGVSALSACRGFIAAFAMFAIMLAGMVAASALPNDPEALLIETRSGPVKFTVELALKPAERSVGLMNRESMPLNHGMLFRFDRTRHVTMWMRNTPLPLDMVFIGEDGVVAGVAHDTTPFSEALIYSPGPVRFVLELNAGVASHHHIAVGNKVRHRIMGK